MSIAAELIQKLERAQKASRELDAQLALYIGFRRESKIVRNDATGAVERQRFWIVPNGGIGKIPNYTGSLDDAIEFAGTVLPGHVGGIAWEDGAASAKINDGPRCSGATPAIALCIAALSSSPAG